MKSIFSTVTLAAAATVFAGSALAADGTIRFTGQVLERTCTVSSDTENRLVTLPMVARSQLAVEGQTAGRTPFLIRLTDCPTDKRMATYFEPGNTVDINTGRLINQASTAGATNVQLQLLGTNAQFLPIRATGVGAAQTTSQWVAIGSDGAATLDYYVEYYATGESTAGDVTSSVQYTIIYQ